MQYSFPSIGAYSLIYFSASHNLTLFQVPGFFRGLCMTCKAVSRKAPSSWTKCFESLYEKFIIVPFSITECKCTKRMTIFYEVFISGCQFISWKGGFVGVWGKSGFLVITKAKNLGRSKYDQFYNLLIVFRVWLNMNDIVIWRWIDHASVSCYNVNVDRSG